MCLQVIFAIAGTLDEHKEQLGWNSMLENNFIQRTTLKMCLS